jgi:hypothetical protein
MKKIIESKTYASMMAHRAAAEPNAPWGGCKTWANLKFKFPVFKSGKVSKYVKLLANIGKTGSTWVNALNELGVDPKMQSSSYFCCYRLSMLNHGLIKKAGRIGRKQKYVLTDLGDRYVSMALRRAA